MGRDGVTGCRFVEVLRNLRVEAPFSIQPSLAGGLKETFLPRECRTSGTPSLSMVQWPNGGYESRARSEHSA